MADNSAYLNAFKTGIIRISHANGVVVGAGFLVFPNYVLTCAHLVAQALTIPPNTPDMPTGLIDLDFPLIAPGKKIKARVEFWQPVNPAVAGEDIAGLKLEDKCPPGVQPVRLVTADDVWQHSVRVFGFPSGHPDGVWATGVLRGELGNGWIQMEAVNVPGYRVEPGFSGAPVWDETLSGVVGMAVAAERQRDGVKAAFMIPTKVLSQAWSMLGQFVHTAMKPKPALSLVQQAKARTRQKTLESLIADYENTYNQLNYTSNAAERNMIKRQCDVLEQEMTEVANVLDAL
ncbi:MAG: trypsin-like peptidase domain-containing protein [Coleofasciculus sp. B1-GNL1-01]|uniref:trypsin-like peptidase domain-containing protein n=1 Tax=Coleofasciculus sp. B1-GNL1-01 TaxID=3068484 RepID=UPI003301E80B